MKRKRKNRRKERKESQLGLGTWHFWFLHIVTLIAFAFMWLIHSLEAGLISGLLMYISPFFAAHQLRLSKSDMARFYKLRSKG